CCFGSVTPANAPKRGSPPTSAGTSSCTAGRATRPRSTRSSMPSIAGMDVPAARLPSKRRLPMKKLVLLAMLGGCGISEDIYNAKVAELNKTKSALDEEQKSAAAAKKKCDEMQAKLDGENNML